MADISRDDLNRLHDAIDDTKKAVGESELRLGARIDAQRLEADRKYVTSAELQLVKNDVTTLAGVVKDALGRRDWTWKTALVLGVTFVSNLLVVILGASGVFK